jgi:diguanylate cyclase (GGDEF)-like protein
MFQSLIRLYDEHALAFVLTALAICSIAAWLLAVLTANAAERTFRQSRSWLLAIIAVAGLGVWTTHFIAVLGFRPDVVFGFDAGLTLLSGIVAFLAVGLPLALSSQVKARAGKALLGGLSGLGVGAMHFIGMSAVQGCLVTQADAARIGAFAAGAVLFAVAAAMPRPDRNRALVSLLFVAGVCGTHFTAIAGVSLSEIDAADGLPIDVLILGGFLSVGAALLLAGAFFALHAAQQFELQEKMHAGVLSTALHNMSNGLVLIDAKGRVALYNERVLELFGIAADEVRPDMPWLDLLAVTASRLGWNTEKQRRAQSNISTWMALDASTYVEQPLRTGRILSIACRPVPGGGAVLTYDDVTAERQGQQQVAHLTHHDPLTGLANRRSLQDRLDALFAEDTAFATLLIDLDRFKTVNDSYGYAAGDGLLVEVGQRLRECVGPHGFVARMGGDEMAALVYGSIDQAMAAAEAIARELAQPFTRTGDAVSIGCSIGVVARSDARNAEALIERAEVALSTAKLRGGGQICRFEDGMLEAAAAERQLAEDLQRAIADQEFTLAYQPILDLGLSRVIGFEALIRWTHPVRGNVPPAQFIPFAEANGMIVAIGEWALLEACRQAAQWPPHIHVAVNVSAVQLRLASIMSHVTQALAQSGLSASRLELELTETAMVEDGAQIGSMLTGLRTLGCKISMDDFGTGYSSLTHLCRFPLDRIKIDRSFVDAAPRDPNALAVLRAVTQMARDLSITTIGEGVETVEQLEVLRRAGCDAAQGYLLGRPMPAAEALALTAQDDRPRRA